MGLSGHKSPDHFRVGVCMKSCGVMNTHDSKAIGCNHRKDQGPPLVHILRWRGFVIRHVQQSNLHSSVRMLSHCLRLTSIIYTNVVLIIFQV